MALTTEPKSKLDRSMQLLRRTGIWLYLVMATLLQALFLGSKEHWPIIVMLAALGLLVSLVGWLVQRNRILTEERNTLHFQLDLVQAEPGEPALTDWQDTLLCSAWDNYPFGMQPEQIVENLPTKTDDDFDDAMETLVKWDYLDFDDGRGPFGEGKEPETYKITKKGRRYVETKWPKRGDQQRQKIHRAIRRRAKQATISRGAVSN